MALAWGMNRGSVLDGRKVGERAVEYIVSLREAHYREPWFTHLTTPMATARFSAGLQIVLER